LGLHWQTVLTDRPFLPVRLINVSSVLKGRVVPLPFGTGALLTTVPWIQRRRT
jgi:hypothetical protein